MLRFGCVTTTRGIACFSGAHAAAVEDSTFGPFTSDVLRRHALGHSAFALLGRSALGTLEMYRWDFVAAYLQGSLEPGEYYLYLT